MFDTIEKIEDGLIHHGNQNRRIYVMKTPTAYLPRFLDRIEQMAEDRRYEKIVAKVPDSLQDVLLQRGYEAEAQIPHYFAGQESCVFMSRFLYAGRRRRDDKDLTDSVLESTRECRLDKIEADLPDGLRYARMSPEDAKDMSELYQSVFASYPFPIHDSQYIVETMQDHVIYHGIWRNGTLIALASSELDREAQSAEMTDFAVSTSSRGRNLSGILLQQMETHLRENETIGTFYTIARAVSYGMNRTFAKNSYTFGGMLVNNTQIAGRIESMNVWFKKADQGS